MSIPISRTAPFTSHTTDASCCMAPMARECLATSRLLPSVTAHEAKDYTILLTSEGTSPDTVPEGVLVTTDRLFFMMVDNRNDTRHMVTLDVDRDGSYDGPDDLSSPWLTSSCELDEEGNRTDTECKVTYTLILGPENGIMPGNISLLIKINQNDNTTNHTLNALSLIHI